MKRLEKRLSYLKKNCQNGNEEFVNGLNPQEVGDFLHLIEVKKRQIESHHFNLSLIAESEKGGEILQEILEVIKELREGRLNKWQKIEELLKARKGINQLKKMDRIRKQKALI